MPEGALSVQLELPGLRPDDLRVVVQPGELMVSGESTLRAGEHALGRVLWLRAGPLRHRVNRRVSLPRHAAAHQASASLTDGVLTITVPTEGYTLGL